jgi:RimJ/RimL family protein N-acetyltransferase
MFMRSERLFLRPGWPEDWSELLTAINDEGIVRNLASAPWPYTSHHAMAFADGLQARMLPHFFITLPSSEGARLIGGIGLARHGDDVELGYWIARKHWGQGFATEASRAVLRLAEALGHRQITAGHFVDNPASGRVLTKAGFVRAGAPISRFSHARGREVPSIRYAVTLDAAVEHGNENYMRAA